MDLTKRYVHRPLDTTRRQIRLLKIDHASSTPALIHATLHHVNLDEDQSLKQLSYTALSYTWATYDEHGNALEESDLPMQHIRIDGQALAELWQLVDGCLDAVTVQPHQG